MSGTNRLRDAVDDETEGDDNESYWRYPRTSSPHSSLSVNNSFTQQAASTTMGSWGFDVNRSINGQTPSSLSSSFTTKNNSNGDRPTREDYNERRGDVPSTPAQHSRRRSPTLTRQRAGNEFAAIDRLALGPHRTSHGSSQQLSMSTKQPAKDHTEHELLAWQSRMLQRDQRMDASSPKVTSGQNGTNSLHSSNRHISTANRRIPAMISRNENQYPDHDHHESTIKSARAIKRYIELVYHLQSFYGRITDQLCNGSSSLKANQSLFAVHCQKITDQWQKLKPIWDGKLAELQNQLKDVSMSHGSMIASQISFLKRRSTLISLLQILSNDEELDITDLSIRTDVDRVLHEDRLAVQLQDELSTLLQHQSLLNDFISLLQWNSSIYSANEQTRAEDVLPILREQMATTDSYLTHVNQQLTELVTNLRSSERYILSYTNSIPLVDDELPLSQPPPIARERRSRHDIKSDIDLIKARVSRDSRALPFSRDENVHDDIPSNTIRKEFAHLPDRPFTEMRSRSVPRHTLSDEYMTSFDRDDLRLSAKNSSMNFNTNNSNNNGVSTRFAAVKSAKRDVKASPTVRSILKSSPSTQLPPEDRREYEVDAPDRALEFDYHDQMRRGDIRAVPSRPNWQEMDSAENDSRPPLDRTRLSRTRERALHLESMLGDASKETTRRVAATRYYNKSYQQHPTNPNY